MQAWRWHASSSSFESPEVSLPNTRATGPSAVAAIASGAAERHSRAGCESSRPRALKPTASVRSASASASVGTTRARSSTSAAPAARATASGCGKWRGATSTRSASPIVFMARAAAPMLPGWLVRESTTATRERGEAAFIV